MIFHMRNRPANMRPHKNNAASIENLSLPQGGTAPASSSTSNKSVILTRQRNILVVVCMALSLNLLRSHADATMRLLKSVSYEDILMKESSPSCEINLGDYEGPVGHNVKSGMIGEPKCLLNSKWMQVSLHTVKFPGSDTTHDDWMWIDYYDRVNVLVEDERKDGETEPRFLVFEQTKYALEGRTSLAIVGGIIEPDEDAESAARREVEEEMDGLVCEKFKFLGRHRSDVNRGMGWLNGYVATNCSRGSKKAVHHSTEDQIGAADTEKQKLKSVSLAELRQALTEGKFMEVQWSATVAQALLQVYL
mmetsp:Transcript_12986/g.36586  ORF Transcript_12986/g.36586 Transcript_12986/m.36586 type:complete len:306 (+) Transcript_12986:89-1006(+)